MLLFEMHIMYIGDICKDYKWKENVDHHKFRCLCTVSKGNFFIYYKLFLITTLFMCFTLLSHYF